MYGLWSDGISVTLFYCRLGFDISSDCHSFILGSSILRVNTEWMRRGWEPAETWIGSFLLSTTVGDGYTSSGQKIASSR